MRLTKPAEMSAQGDAMTTNARTNPIWQTYNRAYKAHYARYMKKKMTISEFEKWSRFASDLRDRAIAGEIDFERYYEEIRK